MQPFPIPNIYDLLLKVEGFLYATSFDLNMGCYHIELNLLAQEVHNCHTSRGQVPL